MILIQVSILLVRIKSPVEIKSGRNNRHIPRSKYEMLMDHLKFVNKVRAAKGRPDAWVMLLLDGVGTHVTAEMLEFFAIN